MTITAVNNSSQYGTTTAVRANVASTSTATAAFGDSVSLSTESVSSAISGETANQKATNVNRLFGVLNANILDSNNLSGVGSAIDSYTNSLASSNVSNSSYTAPSAKYLADLADLKTAAASGNRAQSESALAKAKLDAPDSVAGGLSTAIAKGDVSGEISLLLEGTANIRNYLSTQGFSSSGASAEANAITIGGLSLSAADTPTSSAQTRLQQVKDLALYAAGKQETTQSDSSQSSTDPLSNIVSTLLQAKTGIQMSESLSTLDSFYTGSTVSQVA